MLTAAKSKHCQTIELVLAKEGRKLTVAIFEKGKKGHFALHVYQRYLKIVKGKHVHYVIEKTELICNRYL